MTQIEQIKAEIERRVNAYQKNFDKADNKIARLSTDGRIASLKSLLTFINSLPQEEVGKELELAAERYACRCADSKYGHDKVSEAFKAGAQWQKEQMMAKAVDGEVGYWNIRGLSINMELPSKLEEGDKVKLIVIKED